MGLLFDELELILKKEPEYRVKQVKRLLFCDLIGAWQEATTLPLGLREIFQKKFPISSEPDVFLSDDGKTIKALITFEDGLKIESVLMRYKAKRNTVCVSCQVGCPLGCRFCATGKMGFKRNLTVFEIVSQVLFFARYLKKEDLGAKITNVVYMGMGEPFLNYDSVLGSIRVLNDKEGFNLGVRRFSISTVGLPEGIKRLSKEDLGVNLAISLHAPSDELREQIMPVNKKYPIKEVLKAVDGYFAKTRRKVMFEYLMIKDVNDSDEQARQLVNLLKGRVCVVNLVSYNPTGDFSPSAPDRIKAFKKILTDNGLEVSERYRFGGEIRAGCGQLAGGLV